MYEVLISFENPSSDGLIAYELPTYVSLAPDVSSEHIFLKRDELSLTFYCQDLCHQI